MDSDRIERVAQAICREHGGWMLGRPPVGVAPDATSNMYRRLAVAALDAVAELPDDRLAYSVEQAAKMAGSSRSEIYLALGRKELVAKKHGRRTLILRSDLTDYLAALPQWHASQR